MDKELTVILVQAPSGIQATDGRPSGDHYGWVRFHCMVLGDFLT